MNTREDNGRTPATLVELYSEKRLFRRRQWRWRMRDYRNGQTIAASTEGYENWADMLANLRRVTGLRWYDIANHSRSDGASYTAAVVFLDRVARLASSVLEEVRESDEGVK